MTKKTDDTVWKSAEVANKFIQSERAIIPFAHAQLDIMIRLTRYIEIPIRRILDLGCGDGILGAALLDFYDSAHGTFGDFSPAMLKAARIKLKPFAARAHVQEVDYSTPQWIDSVAVGGTFDVIVSGYSIHHQPDEKKQRIYQEIYDLLSPGGIFIHTEHVASATPWVAKVHDDYLIDTFYDAMKASDSSITREHVARDYVHRDDCEANILAPVEQQCNWLRDIGYNDVDVHFKIFELAIFSGRKPLN